MVVNTPGSDKSKSAYAVFTKLGAGEEYYRTLISKLKSKLGRNWIFKEVNRPTDDYLKKMTISNCYLPEIALSLTDYGVEMRWEAGTKSVCGDDFEGTLRSEEFIKLLKKIQADYYAGFVDLAGDHETTERDTETNILVKTYRTSFNQPWDNRKGILTLEYKPETGRTESPDAAYVSMSFRSLEGKETMRRHFQVAYRVVESVFKADITKFSLEEDLDIFKFDLRDGYGKGRIRLVRGTFDDYYTLKFYFDFTKRH
jgi:hypothetical protein